MSSWTEGYVTELSYPHGYHADLNPLVMRHALLSKAAGHSWEGPLRYLELGFGQGLALNIHAVATGGEFWGCDFNPTHAANARALAVATGANLTLLDCSFEELAARDDLPTFDIIALHGVWSWISEQNRRVIVKIARQHLAIGGIFYVSYNTTPGWSPGAPLRHLMTLHANLATGKAMGMALKIDAAFEFAQSLADADAGYFRANPRMADWLKGIRGQSRSYLAHEYFNADWFPMPFSDIAGYMWDAKLSFAASAHLLEHIDALNLKPDQQKILSGIEHLVLKESVRDYLVDQRFRRDLWIKGARQLEPLVHSKLINEQRFVLTTMESDIPRIVKGAMVEAALQGDVYEPLLTKLAHQAYAPKAFPLLIDLLAGSNVPDQASKRITEALTILAGLGHLAPSQSDEAIAAAKPACDRLNAHILGLAMHSGEIEHLASPVTGGGVAVGRLQQLFLKSIAAGKKEPAKWAHDTWLTLAEQGQRLMNEGNRIETAEDNVVELTRQATEFESKRLPILRALQVA